MEEHKPDPPAKEARPEGLLYHYTSQDGLLGILDNKSIWATHVRFLNDASEFLFGWDKALKTVLEKIRNRDFSDKDPAFGSSLEKAFRTFGQAILNDSRRSEYFVFCFTDDKALDSQELGFEGDRLSQWRGYSKGKQGFSLGFDADDLLRSFTASGNVLHWFDRCEYRKPEQDASIEKLADKHLEEFLATWDEYFYKKRNPSLSTTENLRTHRDYLIKPMMNMYADFMMVGMFIKHESFIEENEWRVSFLPEDRAMCSFHDNTYGLTPYLTIGLDLSKSPPPLKRIVVGPGPHKDEWVQTVNLLLAKCATSGVEVVPSKIPYRNW